MSTSLKQLLLDSSDETLAPGAKQTIHLWNDEPTALQILYTLDVCVVGGWASQFAMMTLNFFLQLAITNEHTTYEDVVKQAEWRSKL